MKNYLNTKLHTPLWLFILLTYVLLLRIPSFFEPYSYGDEMIYLALGEGLRQGVPLYSGIHDNKPPLLYVTAAIAGNLFLFKAILAIWHLITIFVFWKLAENFFSKNSKAQKLATVAFALFTTLPLLEGNIVNAELFMVGPTILAFLLLLGNNLSPKKILLAGFLFAIATLFKVPAAFDMLAVLFLWFVTLFGKKQTVKQFIVNTSLLLIGFITPILLTFVWYFVQGSLKEYAIAAFLQNVGYLSSFRPGDVQEPFLVKNAPLLIRGGVVLGGLLLLFWQRRVVTKNFLLATTWLLFSLFAVTLSERPYPHYLIQSVAPASLLVAFLVFSKKIEQVYALLPLFLLVVVPYYFKFWHYPTLPYYAKFIRFSLGTMTTEEYLTTFGGETTRNYAVSRYIIASTKPNDKIFVWGNSSVIYALTKRLPPTRYVADYHIKDFSTSQAIVKDLEANLPTLIVVLPESNPPIELLHLINSNYGLVDTIDNTRIWRLLSPKIRSLIAP